MKSKITFFPALFLLTGFFTLFAGSIAAQVTNFWSGAGSTDWNNANNWSLGHVPDATENVTITSQGFQPATVNIYFERCKSLIIDAGGAAQIGAGSLVVSQDINISGALSMPDPAAILYFGGNWNNNAGPAGFSAGQGRVVINGDYNNQYCSGAAFNVLELNKAAGGNFIVDGTPVVCAAYHWTSGAIEVLSSSFTANDLLDDGVYGIYYCYGGAINLTNAGVNQWVDIDGEMHIYGGTVTLNGFTCDWGYAANALIEMSGGTLDVPSCNITIPLYHPVTMNITGGTIRTQGSFESVRSDFTPTGGTLELYGPNLASIYLAPGSTLFNLLINKPAINNMAYLSTGCTISNNLTIANGTFYIYGQTLNVTHSTWIAGGLVMDNPAGLFNCGSTPTDNLEFQSGSVSTLTAGSLTPYSWIKCTGPSITITSNPNHYINFVSANSAGIEVDYPGNIAFGTVTLNKPWGDSTCFTSGAGAKVELLGNLGFSMGNGLSSGSVPLPNTQVVVHGTVTENASNWINVHGHLVIDPNFTLNGTLNVGTGNVLLHGNFTTAATSNLSIDGGSLVCDVSNLLDYEHLGGHLNMSGGLLEYSHGHPQFDSGSISAISGGIIRTAGSFSAQFPGSFQPTGGNVELNVDGFGGGASWWLSCNNGNFFYNLTINGVSDGYSVMYTDIAVNHDLTVNTGFLWMYAQHTLNVYGTTSINNGGELRLFESNIFRQADGTSLNINSGGKLNITAPYGVASISRIATGSYALNVQSGGTIAAQNGIFEYMNGNGVNLLPGSIVDTSNAFKGCTFQNGTAGGTLLTVNNNQTFTIHNAVFPDNTWGGASNVTKGVNAGHVYFVDFSGGFSGESYDNDPYNRVDWVTPLTAALYATPTTLCAGFSSQLNYATSGGASPLTFAWSPAAGLSNPNIANPLATPAATTTYAVTVTDALGNVLTDNVTITVNPSTPISVSVVASANPSPPGSYVLFTASPVNGGASPVFQWKVNGVNAGTGLITYSYVPAPNDQVSCTMVSSVPGCTFPNPALSNVITMAVVPINQSVTGTVPSPLHLCFDASNIVSVAGGANTFAVPSGAQVTIIAGQKISILPGATVNPGGYLHGYITTTNSYCVTLPPAMVSIQTTGEGEGVQPSVDSRQSFRVFPNPTTGDFTVEVVNDNDDLLNQVSVYNLNGVKVSSIDMNGERSHRCSVNGLPTGIYFIRVTTGKLTGVSKLVKL